MLAVLNGLVEGLGEVLAHQQGEVGVVGFVLFGLVSVAVDHGQSVLIVFGGHLAGGVGAEGAHLVVEGGGVVNQLGLVKVLVEELHDLVPDLHPHADVHGAHPGLDAVVVADVGEPVGALAADGGNYLGGVAGLVLVGDHALHLAVLNDDVLHHGVELHPDALGQQVLFQAGVYLVALLRAEMADGAFNQL